jgi:hypothetical protein
MPFGMSPGNVAQAQSNFESLNPGKKIGRTVRAGGEKPLLVERQNPQTNQRRRLAERVSARTDESTREPVWSTHRAPTTSHSDRRRSPHSAFRSSAARRFVVASFREARWGRQLRDAARAERGARRRTCCTLATHNGSANRLDPAQRRGAQGARRLRGRQLAKLHAAS